jgi:lambda family phage portal protein
MSSIDMVPQGTNRVREFEAAKRLGRIYDNGGQLIPTQAERTVAASGYANYGANRTKNSMVGWIAQGGSPDEDIVANLQILRERSRDAFMGIPLAAGAIETLTTNVIGPGILAQPNVKGDLLGLSSDQTSALNLELGMKFGWWADDPRECDFEGKSSFYSLQHLAFQTAILSGDLPAPLHLKPRRNCLFDLRIRLLESDRVCDPHRKPDGVDIFGGVELDDEGETVAYHVATSHPLSRRNIMKAYSLETVRIPVYGEETGRRNMLLMMRPERPEQRRGVPIMASSLETLKQQGRFIDSATVSALIQSYFSAWITSEMPTPDMFNELLTPQQRQDLQWLLPYNVQLGPGLINFLKPGQSVMFGNPSQPVANFNDFVVALTKFIGSALGIPYEILLKQFNASYSASRAALLEFWKRVRMWRKVVVEQFCQPIYEEWLEDALGLGLIENFSGDFGDPFIRRALCTCNWMGVASGSLDPLKEAQASEKKIHLLTSTAEREAIETNGSNWHENVLQLGRELEATEAEGLIHPHLRAAPYK